MKTTGDVFYSGRWWDVDDDAKLLRCSDCGLGLWGDTARAEHVCELDDGGSASLFVACLLAGIVPTILALLFVAPFLAALSGVVQS